MIDRREFYEQHATLRPRSSRRYYQRLLRHYYAFWVPPGLRVLELGCGLGDLLAAVKPTRGLGLDFSPSIIAQARQRHPHLDFQVAEAGAIVADEQFDYILLSDLVNDLPDVQAVFQKLQFVSHPRTRLVLNFFNNLWRPVLHLAERLKLKAPTLLQNWLSRDDISNLLHLAGWEVIKTDPRILWPARTPLWDAFCNRWLAPLLPHFCLTVAVIARPKPYHENSYQPLCGTPAERKKTSSPRASPPDDEGEKTPDSVVHGDPSPSPPQQEKVYGKTRPADFSCSVVIPARNEAGNIEDAVLRTPEMGLGTEIIFIEGHSTDNTYAEIQRVVAKYPKRTIKVLKQNSKGKGGAVREAFGAATGDILFILDADLTMPPEELPKFYEAARSGTAEFVNGVRLVYPMEQEAMQFLNMVANKLFGLGFSWLLGQKIKDTLCGTKVIFRKDYQALASNRSYFGDFDPFGDFDLIFGAAKLNLRLVDLPIRYRARTYGQTNIHRWRHGWLLLRMVVFAARRLKFI